MTVDAAEAIKKYSVGIKCRLIYFLRIYTFYFKARRLLRMKLESRNLTWRRCGFLRTARFVTFWEEQCFVSQLFVRTFHALFLDGHKQLSLVVMHLVTRYILKYIKIVVINRWFLVQSNWSCCPTGFQIPIDCYYARWKSATAWCFQLQGYWRMCYVRPFWMYITGGTRVRKSLKMFSYDLLKNR